MTTTTGNKAMYNVIGTHKVTKKRMIIEPHMTETQALKMCESWGWTYDDGTTNGSYWMSMEMEESV